jgi:DeoR/GlpR family transcriptional regulator of sugar metabolism
MSSHAPPDSSEAPLIPDQRREAMLRQLRRDKVLSVQQLMAAFTCSHMTVRRDIAALEQAGLVFTVPGGVRIASHLGSEPSHQSKFTVEQPQKKAIARVAAQSLRAGMTIYLDAGTTMLAIVPHIVALSDMTVITNDFEIVRELSGATHVSGSTLAANLIMRICRASARSPPRRCVRSYSTWPSFRRVRGICGVA